MMMRYLLVHVFAQSDDSFYDSFNVILGISETVLGSLWDHSWNHSWNTMT